MHCLGLHKGEMCPLPHRLAVSEAGSLMHGICKYMGMHLKEVFACCKTCTKNSVDILGRLKWIKISVGNYCITTCDAEAMCPNARTEEAL